MQNIILKAIAIQFLILCILGSNLRYNQNYNKIVSDQDQYNAQEGYSFSFYTKASYCNQDELQNWDCIPCQYHKNMKDIHVIENSQYKSQQYVAYNPDSNLIVIAFRGSSNIRNWLSNLHFTKHTYKYCNKCKVHAGFQNIYEASADEVMQAYLDVKNKYPSAQLLIAGHSLGGAIATLTALEFRRQFIQIDYLYTFGCPRVGNKRFAEYGGNMLTKLNQVIHHKDMVPHVPAMAQGFVRLPTEVWYEEKSDYDINDYRWCPSEPGEEDPNCSDQYSVFTSVEDHLNYYNMYTGCDLDPQDLNNPQFYGNEQVSNKILYFEDEYINGEELSEDEYDEIVQ